MNLFELVQDIELFVKRRWLLIYAHAYLETLWSVWKDDISSVFKTKNEKASIFFSIPRLLFYTEELFPGKAVPHCPLFAPLSCANVHRCRLPLICSGVHPWKTAQLRVRSFLRTWPIQSHLFLLNLLVTSLVFVISSIRLLLKRCCLCILKISPHFLPIF